MPMTLSGLQWNLRHFASRMRAARRKLFWIALHGKAAETAPVFIVGSQRSGTGMIGECLGQSPEFVNLGESDTRAFSGFSLKDDVTIARVIDQCIYPRLVFKPLKDSHRLSSLLSLRRGGKAIWAFRDYLDRVNSAVTQFGRHPLEVCESFLAGDNSHWQLLSASDCVKGVIRSLDIARFSEQDGAALMWWIRNSLYFDLELEKDSRIQLWSYDAFVHDPELELKRLLRFLEGRFHDYMLDSVHTRSVRKKLPPTIDPYVRELCESLQERLQRRFSEQIRNSG